MKNWKTTLWGALGAILNVIIAALTTGSVDPKTVIVSATLAGIGYVAKDAGVSGTEK